MNARRDFKPYSPEQRASFLAWRFGSTLDWSSLILTEIKYPVEELRWFVDAVQGLCKGQERRIAHTTLTRRAQRFKNKAQASELVRRAIEANAEWSRLSRSMIFDIERPRPHEMEGKDKRARTRYTDYLTAAAVFAQETEHKIKKSDELRWKKETEYRSKKRREILDEALKMLPGFERAEDMPASVKPKESKPLSLSEYVAARERIILAENRRVLDRLCDGDLIDADEIDARLATLEVYKQTAVGEIEKAYNSTRAVLLDMRGNRLVRAMDFTDPEEVAAKVDEMLTGPRSVAPASGLAAWLDEIAMPSEKGNAGITLVEQETDAPPNPLSATNGSKGNAHVTLSVEAKIAPDAPESGAQKGNAGVTLPDESVSFSEEETQSPDFLLNWALVYAAQGIAVFPCHTVFDDVCSCLCTKECTEEKHKCGSECGAKGKHPDGELVPRGVKDATTDAAKIRRWWAKKPYDNIGLAMGGPLRLVALDVDPRSGGGASLCDLVEAHGDGFLDTYTQETGGLGNHFLYMLREGVEVVKGNQKGKIAPGVDTKTEGGYLIAAPSLHVSGRRYRVSKNTYMSLAPAFFEEWLSKREPRVVINFQDEKARRTFSCESTGAKFYEGDRNDGLFSVGIGRWRYGWAEDATELHAQMLDVNSVRCVPPLEDAEVAKMAAHIAADYAHLRGVDAEGKGAA